MVDIFSKYVMKDQNKSEVFHSSAYGQAQNGTSMGAASTESFATRRSLDGSRRFVKGYGDSKIAASSMSAGPRPATVKPGSIPTSRINPAGGAGARPAQTPRPPMPRNPGVHF